MLSFQELKICNYRSTFMISFFLFQFQLEATLVTLSDLLVDKSLHRLGWRHLIASLIFMTSPITSSIVTLTIYGVTSILQLMDVQSVCKIHVSVQARAMGNSSTLFKMVES